MILPWYFAPPYAMPLIITPFTLIIIGDAKVMMLIRRWCLSLRDIFVISPDAELPRRRPIFVITRHAVFFVFATPTFSDADAMPRVILFRFATIRWGYFFAMFADDASMPCRHWYAVKITTLRYVIFAISCHYAWYAADITCLRLMPWVYFHIDAFMPPLMLWCRLFILRRLRCWFIFDTSPFHASYFAISPLPCHDMPFIIAA